MHDAGRDLRGEKSLSEPGQQGERERAAGAIATICITLMQAIFLRGCTARCRMVSALSSVGAAVNVPLNDKNRFTHEEELPP